MYTWIIIWSKHPNSFFLKQPVTATAFKKKNYFAAEETHPVGSGCLLDHSKQGENKTAEANDFSETIDSVKVFMSKSLKRPSVIELKSILHSPQSDSACDEKLLCRSSS